MKAKTAIFIQKGEHLKLKELPIPMLNAGEVLVKIEYTTLCGSDIHTFCGTRKEKEPTILGHEIVGRVAAIGGDGKLLDQKGVSLEIDDRISWAIFASDPKGEMTQKGIPQKEKDLFKYGHEQLTEENSLHGGLSEYIILRPYTPILKISDNIPLKVAAIINCAVATMAGAIRLAGDIKGKRILISGAGMLGMVGCAMCKVMDAKEVITTDIRSDRLDLALDFGVDCTYLAESEEAKNTTSRFDIILELSGSPKATEALLPLLDIGGVIVLVGATFPQRNLSINAEKIIRNLWTIRGLHNYNRADFISAVEFMEKYHDEFPFGKLIHDHFKLETINEAFEYAVANKPFRVGVKIT